MRNTKKVIAATAAVATLVGLAACGSSNDNGANKGDADKAELVFWGWDSGNSMKEILADYEAHFEEGKKEGLTEEEISKELGSPKDIYDSYQSEGVVDEKTKTSTLMDGAEKAANAAGKAADAAQKKLGETWDEVSPRLPQAVESTALLTARLLYGAGIVLAVFIAAATILILGLLQVRFAPFQGIPPLPGLHPLTLFSIGGAGIFSALAVLFTGIEGSKALQSTVKKDDHKEEGGEGK